MGSSLGIATSKPLARSTLTIWVVWVLFFLRSLQPKAPWEGPSIAVQGCRQLWQPLPQKPLGGRPASSPHRLDTNTRTSEMQTRGRPPRPSGSWDAHLPVRGGGQVHRPGSCVSIQGVASHRES